MKRILSSSYHHVILLSNDFNLDRRMIRIARSLEATGAKILIIYRRLEGLIPEPWGSIDLRPIDCFFNRGPLFYLELNFRMLLILRGLNYHSLTSVDLDTVIPGILGNQSGKSVRKYFDAHEWFEEVPELLKKTIRKAIWRGIGKYFVPKFDIRFTVSEGIANKMSETYRAPFEVIRNFPLQGISHRPIKQLENQIKLVYLGALNPGRGLEEIIICLKTYPRVSLDIYGTGPEEEKLKVLAIENSAVRFKGFLNRCHIRGTLVNYDVGINLLDSKSQSYFLSLANKTFDYLNVGLPVLAMSFPEYQMLNEHTQALILLENLGKEHIVAALDKILDEPDYYRLKQSNAVKSRELWTWEKEEKLLLKLYQQQEL